VTPSASFALTNLGGAGVSLTFTQQPVNTAAGAIMPAVVVHVTDTGGNPVSGVTIALTAQGGPGTLTGTSQVATDASGLATFSNLSINKTGTYALQATDGTRFTTSSSFVITPGTSSTITVVAGSGQSAVVSTPYATSLKVSVQDAEGNGIPGVSVTFSAPTSGASVTFSGPTTVTTDSTGVAAISVTANTQVGPFQVTAAATGIATPALFSLTNVPGTATRLTFVQQPSNAAAGAIIVPPITVQLTDNLGNHVAQAGVTITLALNPVAGPLPSVSGTTTVQTNAAGLATFSDLSISTAGTYQFTAIGTSLVSVQSTSFTISTGTAAVIQAVAGTPQSTTVLAPFAVPLQVLVADTFGNPLSGLTVTFTAPTTGASATLSAATATTDANGHASVSATANGTAGSYTVSASVAGVTPSASFALTNVTGVGSSLTFTQQPVSTPAGAIMPAVAVRATDNGGNPISGVTISLSAQGGPGVLSGATPVVTDAAGLATFTNLSIDKTGISSLQATDGTHFATSNSFVITPGTASSITVVAGSGQSAAVGAPYATALKASVQDVHGNGVPGVSVTFTAPASGASVTFSGPTTVPTDSTGVAAISATANTQVGSFQVTAAATGIATPAVFTLTNVAGTASRLSFVQQPTATVAGAIVAPPVTVQLTDGVGNPIAQSGVVITLSLNPLAGRLRSISGTVATTNASGLATFSNLSISTVGVYQLTASGVSFVSAQSIQFVVSPGAASVIQATGGTPQSTTALAPFAVPLQVLVTDAFANPLSGVTVTFAAPSSGASASLSATTTTTDPSGHASVTATANSVAGSYAVTASVSGVTPAASFALTNVSGGGSLLSFTQQPANTSAGAPTSVTVKFTDAAANPISGAVVSLALTGGTGLLIGTLTATTDTNGTAVFNNLHIDVTGSYQLVASTGGIFALSSTFQIGPAVGRTVTVISGNNQGAAAGDPYAIPLTVSVTDGLGNPVPGAQVTFTPPTAGASVTFGGSNTVTSGANGLASSPIVTANLQPGVFQVSATTPGAAGQATFNLQNLTATATRMQFVQQPSDTTAGTAIAPAVTIRLADRFGNSVAQAGVSIQLFLVSTTTVSANITGATVQTNSSGLATFPNLSIAQAGTYQLLALATGFESSVSASFHVTGGAPTGVTTTGGTPQSTTVRTTFAQPLVALVTDAAGNPLSGKAVTFTAPTSGASGTFAAGGTTVTATTDVNGRATSPVFTANSTSGVYTVTASVTAVSGSAAFALANLQPGALTLAFLTQPSNAASGTVISPPVRVQLEDTSGQPVNQSGVAVLLTVSQGTGSLSGTSVQMTDASGIATFSDLSIDLAGPKRLRAFGSAEAAADSNQFQISAGALARLVPVSGGAQITAPLSPFSGPLQVRVEDAVGNPVPGVAVTFNLPASGSSGTFAGPAVIQSGADGVATSPLITANGIQGVFTATASAANVGNAEFVLAIIQPSSGFLQVTPTATQFVQTFGGSAPSPQTATIVSTATSELPWTATSTAPWLSVSPASGTTPAQITLTANGAGLAPGRYGALVTIADTSGDQQTIFVVFTVSGAASLVVQPPALAFVAVAGPSQLPAAVPPQQIRVTSTNALAAITFKITAQVETPSAGTWLTIGQASGSTTGTITASVDVTGLQPGVYSGLVTLTPDDTSINPVTVPVTLVIGCGSSGCPLPGPAGHAITNAASFHSGASPGGAHTLFGAYLAASTQTASSFPLPTSLAGTRVLVNGIAAPLYYVSPSQINFQMPSGTAQGSASIVVTTIAGSSSGLTSRITPVQPGLFVSPDLRAKALNQDLTLHTPQTPIGGGGYVILYLTGMGPTTPAVPDGQPAPTSPLAFVNGSVSATVGGRSATVQFAGLAPGFAGLIQVNVQIPTGLSLGDQPVFVTINGSPSNAGVIAVK
jgi:adhesin/invasin